MPQIFVRMPDIGDDFVTRLPAPCLSSGGGGAVHEGESNLGGFHRDSVVCQAFVIVLTGQSKWPQS